tara:strand:- start:432 stop:647 length:216 start_codon:yes stop_codon:yes gene_type:complete
MKGQVRGLALELLMASPCINICHLNDNDICVGCFRSSEEITTWKDLDDEARKQILAKARKRELTLNAPNSF